MTTSDWLAIGTIFFTGFGGVASVLFKMNGTLGKVVTEIKYLTAALDNHDKRLRKVEKSLAKLSRAHDKP